MGFVCHQQRMERHTPYTHKTHMCMDMCTIRHQVACLFLNNEDNSGHAIIFVSETAALLNANLLSVVLCSAKSLRGKLVCLLGHV